MEAVKFVCSCGKTVFEMAPGSSISVAPAQAQATADNSARDALFLRTLVELLDVPDVPSAMMNGSIRAVVADYAAGKEHP